MGLDFIDILFGLVVSEIFVQFPQLRSNEKAFWAEYILALVVVTFSWIGYHVNKRTATKDVDFLSWSFPQFLTDIAIIAVYLALVKQIEHAQITERATESAIEEAHVRQHPPLVLYHPSIRIVALTIVVVFALYVVFDLFEVLKGRDRSLAHFLVSLTFLVLMAVFWWIIRNFWMPGTSAAIIGASCIYVALLYVYRLSQRHYSNV